LRPEHIIGVCFLLNSAIIKKMKKTFAILAISILMAPPLLALAVTIENPVAAGKLEDLIGKIVDFIFSVSLLVVPLMIIVGAFYFVTAAGNPSQIETGKRLVLYALIGFIIILLAKGLVAVIGDILGV